MMKKLLILLLVASISACGSPNTATHLQGKAVMAGGDSDSHGCKASAGYRWSKLMQSCIRIFEQGIRLDPQDSQLNPTLSAFVVFNQSQSEVELFLPNKVDSRILARTGNEGAHRWVDSEFVLYPWKGYVLKDKNSDRVLYHGEIKR